MSSYRRRNLKARRPDRRPHP